jgi:hypothetical protein
LPSSFLTKMLIFLYSHHFIYCCRNFIYRIFRKGIALFIVATSNFAGMLSNQVDTVIIKVRGSNYFLSSVSDSLLITNECMIIYVAHKLLIIFIPKCQYQKYA